MITCGPPLAQLSASSLQVDPGRLWLASAPSKLTQHIFDVIACYRQLAGQCDLMPTLLTDLAFDGRTGGLRSCSSRRLSFTSALLPSPGPGAAAATTNVVPKIVSPNCRLLRWPRRPWWPLLKIITGQFPFWKNNRRCIVHCRKLSPSPVADNLIRYKQLIRR